MLIIMIISEVRTLLYCIFWSRAHYNADSEILTVIDAWSYECPEELMKTFETNLYWMQERIQFCVCDSGSDSNPVSDSCSNSNYLSDHGSDSNSLSDTNFDASCDSGNRSDSNPDSDSNSNDMSNSWSNSNPIFMCASDSNSDSQSHYGVHSIANCDYCYHHRWNISEWL